MADEWLEARSIDEIEAHRDEMLACSLGTDVDHNDIAEEMPEHADAEPDEIEALWFNLCVRRLREAFAGGTATLHRAISVDDVDAFLEDLAGGAEIGCHWTWDKECATTNLHGGEWREHDILLTAEVAADAVDWATTFQQHFAHPCEREVRVSGAVLLTGVVLMETGEALAWEPRRLAA